MLRLTIASIGFVSIVGAKHAEAQTESIYLDYSASAGCASRAEFVAQAQARTAVARFSDSPGGGRQFRVTVGQMNGHAVGRVSVGRGTSVGSAREVYAQDCNEVVRALALIVALALDPDASLTVESTPTANPNAPAPPAVFEMHENGVSQSAAARGSALLTPKGTFKGPPITHVWLVRAQVQLNLRSPHVLAFGVHAGATVWPSSPTVPALAWALSLAAEDWPSLHGIPSVRLSVQRSTSAIVHSSRGSSAKLASTAARLALCPLQLDLTTDAALLLCAGADMGRLTAAGYGGELSSTAKRQRPWLAIVESARLRLGLGRDLYTDIEGGVSEPLWRDAFEFGDPGAPAVAIVTTPPLVLWLNLGFAVRFW
ncbi:MAG TPA: hypothetical protein VIV60_06620 [Polyangiaceae bacterium]